MENNHVLNTFKLGTLPNEMGEIEVVSLAGESYYESLASNTENLMFKISFFKTSGKWYTTEYFSIQGLKFTANEIYKAGYEKASYQLYENICDFAEKGYNGYKEMTAVLEFPAFYPSLFIAEKRKRKEEFFYE